MPGECLTSHSNAWFSLCSKHTVRLVELYISFCLFVLESNRGRPLESKEFICTHFVLHAHGALLYMDAKGRNAVGDELEEKENLVPADCTARVQEVVLFHRTVYAWGLQVLRYS